MQKVTIQASEFNAWFITELCGRPADNSRNLEVVQEALRRAMQEDITARQREMLMLYYYENLRQEQIGERLGVNKSTVSRTIKRARQRLEKSLHFYVDYLHCRYTE